MGGRRLPKRLIDFYVRRLKHSPAYVIINTMAAIIFAILFGLWIHQNRQLHHQASIAKVLAVKAKELSANTRTLTKQNEKLIVKIQNERRDLLYRGCRDQNARHDDSLTALKKLLRKSGVSQTRRIAAYQQTKILIDALVPKYNCVKLANRFVKPTPKK